MKLSVENCVATLSVPPEEREAFLKIAEAVASSEHFVFEGLTKRGAERVMMSLSQTLQVCDTAVRFIEAAGKTGVGNETIYLTLSMTQAECFTLICLGTAIDSEYFEHIQNQLLEGLRRYYDTEGVFTTAEFGEILCGQEWVMMEPRELMALLTEAKKALEAIK